MGLPECGSQAAGRGKLRKKDTFSNIAVAHTALRRKP